MCMAAKTKRCKYGVKCQRGTFCSYMHAPSEWVNQPSQCSKHTFNYNNHMWNIAYDQNCEQEHKIYGSRVLSSLQEHPSNNNFSCTNDSFRMYCCNQPAEHSARFGPNRQRIYRYENTWQHQSHMNVWYDSEETWERSSTDGLDPDSKSNVANKTDSIHRRSITSARLQPIKEQIKVIFENDVPEISRQHKLLMDEQRSSIEDLDEEHQLRVQKEENLQELTDQFNVFQQAISDLSKINPMSRKEAYHHLSQLKREIGRLKTRLPIYAQRQYLIDTIKSNRVTILKADTGSGKSSQLIQYLADAGFTDKGQIVCSQPRRLAVRELATRVAKEFGCQVGEEVGFHVGAWRPLVSRRTLIRFVTDAVLLNEYQVDPMLRAYTVVIIDEAHERHVDTDLLFGVMKLCLRKRPDIKLIVMSATLDDKLLSKYYSGTCLVEIPGRMFPIKDIYAMEDAENHVDEAVKTVMEIHASNVPGDILVFLTGQDEINKAIDEVTKRVGSSKSVLVLLLHGKLNEDEIQAVFMPKKSHQQRKIVFSTNVAETSVTIDGIRHVIDTGMVKEVMWDSKRHIRLMKVGYTTQSSIKQRRGRAGRTSSGMCYHLYTYDTYQSLEICSRAEILCVQPSIAVLKLKHLDIVDDITKFDWLEPPSSNSLQETVKSLTWLGAIDSSTGKLTDIGRSMAKLGFEPMLSVMILTAKKLNCLSHVIALAGMLSVVQNMWWRGDDDQSQLKINQMRASFARDVNVGGDFIVILRIFVEWYCIRERKESNKAWCMNHMIRRKSMMMANTVIKELIYQMDPNFQFHLTALTDELIERIVRCISAGFFQNLAISHGPIRAGYQLANSTSDTAARIHRSSVITYDQEPPKFVLYHDIININETNFLTVICPVELDWLNKPWLDSLPKSPSQCVFDSYTFINIGPALLDALVGKKCKNIPQLQEQLHVLFEVDRTQSKLTIWGNSQNISNAKECLHQILDGEREKLRNELQEFQIIGTTRVLLGAGAEPRLVLIEDEYTKIFLKNLPQNITEEEIRQKCQVYGTVENVTIIQANHSNYSAALTYSSYNDARRAVNQLSSEKWNEYKIYASPSYIKTSINTNKQNYRLKAEWFLTESECSGRITFNSLQKAKLAHELLMTRYHYRCQFEMNSNIPTIKCTWPLKPHHGHAIVNFSTEQKALQALEVQYQYPFRIERSRRSNQSLYVRRIPADLDEVSLKATFTDCTHVMLLRIRTDTIIPTPSETEETVYQLFNKYSSFKRESVFVEPFLYEGRVVAYAQFTDIEQMRVAENELNNMQSSIGVGKLRLSVQQPQQQSNMARRSNENQQDEFRIKLYKLPSHIHEKSLIKYLNENKINDSMTYTMVFRKKLPANYFLDRSKTMAEDNRTALIKLKEFFGSHNLFISDLNINVRSPTEDGRAAAFIHFDDPRDIITAINICNSLDKFSLENIGLNQLHFTPVIINRIVIDRVLAQVISSKIEETSNIIQTSSDFSSVTVFRKNIKKDDKTDILILIRGTNLQQLYKARILFDTLLKGLQFQLHNHSWATVLFDKAGQQFLQELQKRTGTYIWWNWKSTFLRIYGEDSTCQDACRQIHIFIQETLKQREYSTSIPIPKNCVRQCIQHLNTLRDLNNKQTKVVVNIVKRCILVSGDREAATKCEQKLKHYLDEFTYTSNCSNISSSEKITCSMNSVCFICSCNFDSPYTLVQCGHTFCRSCLSTYIDTYFDVTLNFASFKISCPFMHCSEPCLIRDIVAVIGFERLARLAVIAFQVYIRRIDSDLVQCMGLNCKQVYRPSKCASMYFCDQCVQLYCIPCKAEQHIGMTCEQFKKLHEEKDESAILEYNIGRLPHKPCPKCHTPIDKYSGCNAVKCTLCNIQFCWICGATDDTDIHNHFIDPESSCYNKMME